MASAAKRETAYIASTNANVVDADDDIVRVAYLRDRPVFILGLPWSVEKAREILILSSPLA